MREIADAFSGKSARFTPTEAATCLTTSKSALTINWEIQPSNSSASNIGVRVMTTNYI
eukprot:SAG22_NODE_15902_length_337_cov_1.067227_2_plen_57_part_01